jgi:hypothetical protein
MNKLILIGLLLWLMPNLNSQTANQINWSDFEQVGSKKVEIDFLGMKDSVSWPIFSSPIQDLNGKQVVLEGYVMCMQASLDPMDTAMTEVCILTISKEPTIKICGVPQFRDFEFVRLLSKPDTKHARKVKIQGELSLNQNGGDGSLINIIDPKVLNK